MTIETEGGNTGFTILMPTYNRPQYIIRILSYYDSFGENFTIVVADSSSDENKKLNEKFISTASNLNILHLSDYPTTIDGIHKIDDALNYVNTKYCVFCADDDFVTPNGINQSVEFLEKNRDFAIAHGHYISFHLKADKGGKQQFCWQHIYPYKSITFPDAKTRLDFHFSNYYPTFYAVHRAAFLKMIYKETMKFTDDYRFGELLPSKLTLIYGKMKRLDVFYAARESIPGSSGQNCEHLSDFIKAGTYAEKYAKFSDCLVTHLSKKSQLDVEESKKIVDDAMSVYLSTSTNYKRILIHKMSDILDYLRLSEWMDEGIRSGYRKLFLLKQMQMKDFRSSVDVPSSKYYDDFNKIRLHVLSYSNSKK